jgi:hypothetical protein
MRPFAARERIGQRDFGKHRAHRLAERPARNRGHDGGRFRPDHLGFRQGVRYRLRLENSGTEPHEFTAPAFFKAIDLANPHVLTAGGQEVILQPGEWKEVYFAARQPGVTD